MKTLTTLFLLLSTTAPLLAAVEVTPFRIEESRSHDFGDDRVSRQEPEMKLILSLKGPEAEAATCYGDIKLEEAVDNTSASLLPKKEFFNDEKKFKDFDNSFFRKSNFGGGPPAAPQVELRLATPARAATNIARLRGSISVAGADTTKSIEVTGLKDGGKKKLDVPAEAHLSITINPASDGKSVGVEYTGDENAVESIEIVNSAGDQVSAGTSNFSLNGGPIQRSIDLSQPLDNSMKLVAKITFDRKVTVVPFDLKNIPLP